MQKHKKHKLSMRLSNLKIVRISNSGEHKYGWNLTHAPNVVVRFDALSSSHCVGLQYIQYMLFISCVYM